MSAVIWISYVCKLDLEVRDDSILMVINFLFIIHHPDFIWDDILETWSCLHPQVETPTLLVSVDRASPYFWTCSKFMQ
jgi:hypothetical protein